MRISSRVIQISVLVAFVALCTMIFSYLWVNSGGKIPGITQPGYRVVVEFPRVSNLVYFGDVMVAGVKVGKVASVVPEGDSAVVTIDLDGYAPLHEGAVAQIRAKTLVNENYVEILDGTGPPLPSGTVLPKGAGQPQTKVNDVLLALDEPTREALGSMVRSLGAGAEGTREAYADAFRGLGSLGRGGQTALDALADQSEDLRQLSANTATMLKALNTQRGQIADLVEDANRLTTATSQADEHLAQTIRELPPTLTAAQQASDDLTRLGNALQPVAENLEVAAPDLNAALVQLPETTRDLRDLLPDLDGVLDDAPETLVEVPNFSDDLVDLIPQAITDLADLNPSLGYVRDYRATVAPALATFGQTFANGDANGKYFRVNLLFGNPNIAFKNMPVNTQQGPFDQYNPYPKPGQVYSPSGEGRDFTRLEEEGPG